MTRPNRPSRRVERARRRLRDLRVESLEGRILLATLTVDTVADFGTDTGTLSLREAIEVSDGTLAISALSILQRAQVSGALSSPNLIAFAIPGAGVHTIAPAFDLPAVTSPAIIDGDTQPGAHPNTNGPGLGDDAVLLIELDGANTAGLNSTFGLTISAGGSTVRGLVLNRWDISQNYDAAAIHLTTNGGDTIAGNFIGTDPSGTTNLGGLGSGVLVQSVGNTIGGTDPAARNVISGNVYDVDITGTFAGDVEPASGNVVQGNLIGTDASGTAHPAGTTDNGVQIAGSSDNTIGGTTPGARNVISTHGEGVLIEPNLTTASTGNVVQGDYVGTDVTGLRALGSGLGFDLYRTTSTTIGGTAPGAGNVISGNVQAGIIIDGDTGDLVAGNLIGTAEDGIAALPNANAGILLQASGNSDVAAGDTIGGTAPGSGNVIAFNGGSGVVIADSQIASIPILGNSIFGNTGLGIDLGRDGVTPNTPGGPHTGANDLQNYPVISSVATTATDTVITGTLNAAPGTPFTVQFFSDPAADPSGHGQGRTYLGELTGLETDTTGNASFTASLPVPVTLGQFVTATATDPAGNTSEFSADVQLAAPVNPLVVTTTADGGPGSLRAAITYANANPGIAPVITFAIPGAGVHAIAPLSPLPALAASITIDGYSQPGARANTLAQGDDAVILIQINGALTGNGGLAPSAGDGLVLTGGASTVRGLAIGGFAAGAGIHILSRGGDTIAGNFLGINATGTTAVPNNVGVQVESPNNTIGGTTPADRDVVATNAFIQVYLLGATATGNRVAGDFVGTDAAGSAAPASSGGSDSGGGDGVDIDAGAAGNTVGGTTPAARNILSGNKASGVRIAEAGTDNNVVEGNFIGTDVTGTRPLGNAFHGVLVQRGADFNLIGGADPGTGNVISANAIEGVTFADAATMGNAVLGNRIGTDATGTIDLGNKGDGVSASFGSSDNRIGGTTPGSANTIADNLGDGVNILGGAGNVIVSNSISGNHLLGIDLGGDGVTPDTPGGPHAGSNDLQNFPVLTSVATTATATVITGTLDGTPSTTFLVQFFGDDAADPSGHGQGKIYLGESTAVTTNAAGFASFTASLTTPIRPGQFVTATATDARNNTSEFAQDLQLSTTPTADLRVSISPATPAAARTNQPYTYTVTVTNAGPQAATGVVLKDTTARGAILRTVTTAGAITPGSTGLTDVTFATLAVGASATATFVVVAALPGTFIDTATAMADQADPTPANNAAAVTEAVVAPPPATADLAVTGTAAPNPTAVGGALTYTFTVTNRGPDPATGVTLVDALPAGLKFVSVASRPGNGTLAAGVVTDRIGTLAVGATATVTIVATPTAAGTIADTATVRADQADSAAANNRATVIAVVAATPTTPINVFSSLVQATSGPYHVLVTWGDPGPAAAGARFNVYRSVGTGPEVKVSGPAGVAAHDFVDTGAAAGATYKYRVTAVLGGVESARSAGTSIEVGLPSAGFAAAVTSLYRSFLHRAPEPSGLKGWVGQLDAGVSLAAVALAIQQSPEALVSKLPKLGLAAALARALQAAQVSAKVVLPPPAPTSLILDRQNAAGTESVLVLWSEADTGGGPVTFDVYRSATPGGEGTAVYANRITGHDFDDNGALPGHTYYYRVAAVIGGVEGPRSAEVHVAIPPVAAPTDLITFTHAGSDGAESVLLLWSEADTGGGPVTFDVYRSATPGGEGSLPQSSGITARDLDIGGLTPGRTYYYQVSAVEGGVEGPRSAESHATLPVPAPSQVLLDRQEVAGSTFLTVIWGYPAPYDAGATFDVYRSEVPGGEGATPYATRVTGHHLDDTDALPGHTYYYRVTAVLGGVASVPSAEVGATLAVPPVTPSIGGILLPQAAPGSTRDVDLTLLNADVLLRYNDLSLTFNLYRSTGPGSTPVLYKAGLAGTADFTDRVPASAASRTFHYQLTAVRRGVESPRSDEVTVTVPPGFPAPQIEASGLAEVPPLQADWFNAIFIDNASAFSADPNSVVTFNLYGSFSPNGRPISMTGLVANDGEIDLPVNLYNAVQTFHYQLTAVIDGVEGPRSNAVTVTDAALR